MKVTVISSGSKGNSTLVETKSKNILIDAGISSKEIKKRLNKDINIDLLFITHAHIDHIKGLKSVYKEFTYTPNLKRPISIIDPETTEEVKPTLYFDEETNEVKGKCKLKPYKSYFAFEIRDGK